MSNPKPNIRVSVDVTNPGQFFACCGLLELADRLWRGAEGWFEDQAFCIACDGTLLDLLSKLATAQINSSLSDQELQRLGTLLSAEKASLTPTEVEEKDRLREMWKKERLHLSMPFDLWIDWWLDDETGAAGMKTWAAKQLVMYIARPLLQSLRSLRWDEGAIANCLQRTATVALLTTESKKMCDRHISMVGH